MSSQPFQLILAALLLATATLVAGIYLRNRSTPKPIAVIKSGPPTILVDPDGRLSSNGANLGTVDTNDLPVLQDPDVVVQIAVPPEPATFADIQRVVSALVGKHNLNRLQLRSSTGRAATLEFPEMTLVPQITLRSGPDKITLTPDDVAGLYVKRNQLLTTPGRTQKCLCFIIDPETPLSSLFTGYDQYRSNYPHAYVYWSPKTITDEMAEGGKWRGIVTVPADVLRQAEGGN